MSRALTKFIIPTAVGLPTAVGAYLYESDEGVRRSVTFWRNIFPVYLHYRAYQFLSRDLKLMSTEDADKKYDELHEMYSDKIRLITFNMRGFYLKQAQLMSTQDDFVPPPYMKWVKDTQDNVPSEFQGSEAKDYCKKLVRDELGMDFDDLFSSWDEEPIGVASIGQVHRATLRSNGRKVAVKILVPGIEAKFRSDIRTLKSFCELAMPQHVSSFDEIERQFVTEFDYRREAENLSKIRAIMFPKWSHAVNIPRPYEELCSKHLLVMEYLDGVRLVEGIRSKLGKLATLQGRTLEDLEEEHKDAVRNGKFVFKTIEENKREQANLRWALYWKDALNPRNVLRTVYNYSPLAFIYGPTDYERTEPPVDLGQTIELLAQVHGYQIFAHGIFNGDPHPGNILLCNDGKLGLIDYGQVKTMTEEQRIKYAMMILAHSNNDRSEIIRLHYDVLGTKTKYRKEDIGYLMSCFYNDRDTDDVTNGLSIASFIDYLEAQDPMVQVPEDYIMACRVSIMLRGLGKAFGLRLRMAPLWAGEANAFLKDQKVEYAYVR